jgi:hypothetical protein
MPSLDEMLAAIAAEDEGEETETTEAAQAPAPKSNSAIKAVRDHAKKLERELAAATKERDELRQRDEERTAAENARILADAGLSPRQADVFLKFYGSATPENVAEFRKDVLGAGSSQEEEQRTEFRPTGPAGGEGLGEKPLTVEDLKKLKEEDPTKAWELARSGKVQFRT